MYPWAVAAVAGPLAALGFPERAATLLSASDSLQEAIGINLQPTDQVEIDRYRALVEARLDEDALESARAVGRDMSLEEAIALAMEKVG
jgi:hypothetical protein